MEPVFFRTPEEFRAWLHRHHRTAKELLVGFHTRGSGETCITWPESVDEALCVGWIDGVRKNLDTTRYTIRFTPRRPGSIWSAVNIRRVAELTAANRMLPAGLEAFAARTEKRSSIYSYEQKETAAFTVEEQASFRANPAAWTFFAAQPPGYRKTLIWWVVSEKKDDTSRRRLEILIRNSELGIRLR